MPVAKIMNVPFTQHSLLYNEIVWVRSLLVVYYKLIQKYSLS